MMSRVVRAVRAIGSWVLLGCVVLLALLTVVIPMVLGLKTYTVLTGSMSPSLQPGALIGVKPMPIHEINPGDIVTYQIRSGDPTVATHRVVGLMSGTEGRLLITKGDANDRADPAPIQEEQLIGVVQYAVPYLGYVNVWGSPTAKAIGTTVAGAALILWGVVKLVRPGNGSPGRTSPRHKKPSRAPAVVVIGAITGLAFTTGVAAEDALAHDPREAAEQDLHEQKLRVSLDGTTWSESVPLDLGQDNTSWVPGDSATAIVYVQNTSEVAADLALRVRWDAASPAGDSLVLDMPDAFQATTSGADVSGIDFTEIATLEAGETITLPITLTFAPDVGDRQLTGEVIEFSGELRLTEAVLEGAPEKTKRRHDQSMLEMTGSSQEAWFIGGLVLTVVGAALILTRRRSSQSSEPADTDAA